MYVVRPSSSIQGRCWLLGRITRRKVNRPEMGYVLGWPRIKTLSAKDDGYRNQTSRPPEFRSQRFESTRGAVSLKTDENYLLSAF